MDHDILRRLAFTCFRGLAKFLSEKEAIKYPASLPDDSYPIFVTWEIGIEDKDILRGCIGTFASDKLSTNLVKYALIAGLHDSRFPPIQEKELPHLRCSISLLTDFKDIENPLDWSLDTHGIEIDFTNEGRHYRGTYLPDVAKKQGWDQVETLEHLCQKAGFKGGFEVAKETMKTRRYQSRKAKVTYEEFQAFCTQEPKFFEE